MIKGGLELLCYNFLSSFKQRLAPLTFLLHSLCAYRVRLNGLHQTYYCRLGCLVCLLLPQGLPDQVIKEIFA